MHSTVLKMAREIKDLDTMKAIELDIMKLVHQFCEGKNEIKYYLAYGTFLVRFVTMALYHGMMMLIFMSHDLTI